MKLLILDYDGILTDGIKRYTSDGKIVFKQSADIELTAVDRFKAKGIDVCVLSGDPTNETFCKLRGIDFFSAIDKNGKINKLEKLLEICDKYQVSFDEVGYAGDDDTYDLPVIDVINNGGGLTFAPWNCGPEIAGTVKYCSGYKSGENFLAWLYYDYFYYYERYFGKDS